MNLSFIKQKNEEITKIDWRIDYPFSVEWEWSIPSSTKILIYFGNSTIFVCFSWHPPVCDFAMVPGVYILLCPQEEKVLFFLHIQLHNHQKDLNPCLLWLYHYGKNIVELEKNKNNKNRQNVHGACNLTKQHFKILICVSFHIMSEQSFT